MYIINLTGDSRRFSAWFETGCVYISRGGSRVVSGAWSHWVPRASVFTVVFGSEHCTPCVFVFTLLWRFPAITSGTTCGDGDGVFVCIPVLVSVGCSTWVPNALVCEGSYCIPVDFAVFTVVWVTCVLLSVCWYCVPMVVKLFGPDFATGTAAAAAITGTALTSGFLGVAFRGCSAGKYFSCVIPFDLKFI